MKKTLAFACFSAGALCAVVGSAQIAPTDPTGPSPVVVPDIDSISEADLNSVLMLLDAVHELPPREAFEAAAPDVQGILWSIATAEDVFVLHRDRALDALSYWPSTTHAELLIATVEDPEMWEGTVHRSLLLLAQHYPERALPLLESALNAEDVQMQLTGVEGLRLTGLDEAVELLQSARGATDNRVVLENIDEALELR